MNPDFLTKGNANMTNVGLRVKIEAKNRRNCRDVKSVRILGMGFIGLTVPF
jgi:hypothetical protein